MFSVLLPKILKQWMYLKSGMFTYHEQDPAFDFQLHNKTIVKYAKSACWMKIIVFHSYSFGKELHCSRSFSEETLNKHLIILYNALTTKENGVRPSPTQWTNMFTRVTSRKLQHATGQPSKGHGPWKLQPWSNLSSLKAALGIKNSSSHQQFILLI